MAPLRNSDIRRLFDLLNEELRAAKIEAELFLVGGAVMCLAYATRPSTEAVDAVFRPAAEVRKAAARVAARAGVCQLWTKYWNSWRFASVRSP
jgi:methylmalonyl-CoA mutase cobalamin-binding subunit